MGWFLKCKLVLDFFCWLWGWERDDNFVLLEHVIFGIRQLEQSYMLKWAILQDMDYLDSPK